VTEFCELCERDVAKATSFWTRSVSIAGARQLPSPGGMQWRADQAHHDGSGRDCSRCSNRGTQAHRRQSAGRHSKPRIINGKTIDNFRVRRRVLANDGGS
jgi:hypothetical protein